MPTMSASTFIRSIFYENEDHTCKSHFFSGKKKKANWSSLYLFFNYEDLASNKKGYIKGFPHLN